MSIVASLIRPAVVAAVLLVAAPPIVPAAELECADDAVSAHGNGFSPSPELSAEAAKIEWLKKATAIYSDAKMETAKNPQISCVNQGLYSNCTISAVPAARRPPPPSQTEVHSHPFDGIARNDSGAWEVIGQSSVFSSASTSSSSLFALT
jgi:hypothetical protein